MAKGSRDRRFQISLPLLKEIRLILWAHTRGVSKTRMAEAIVIDRVSARCNWDEVCRDLKQEAALYDVTPSKLIAEILGSENLDIDLAAVDWSALLDGEETSDIDQPDEGA